jgi:hypothetical protein
MELSSQQKMSIERLYENESLTDNLTDQEAKAVLQWAQQQIASNTDGELVKAAVSAANQSGEQGAQALLAQATTFLVQELQARGVNTARENQTADSPTMQAGSAEASTPLPEGVTSEPTTSELGARADTGPNAARLGTLGEAAEQGLPAARADARIAPKSPAKTVSAPKKSRRKSSRSKKTRKHVDR